MDSFDKIRGKLGNAELLQKVPLGDIDTLRAAHPQLPKEYLEFLHEVGFGNVGGIQLYSRPARADAVYCPMPGHLQTLLLIGDDMQGYCFAFDPENEWRIVEISPTGAVTSCLEADFPSLLNAYV